MHVVWVTESAAFVGGCEYYVFRTAQLLSKHGVRSTLYYDPESPSDVDYLSGFDAAFPLVNAQQLKSCDADVCYFHKGSEAVSQALAESSIPVVRFYHDHDLFCLRKHKVTTLSKTPCSKTIGLNCYSCLGFVNRTEQFPGAELRTLGSVRKAQATEKNYEAYVVASEYMKQHIVAHGYDPERTHLLPLYVEETETHGVRNPAQFLFVGQLTYGKGFDLLLQSLSMVSQPFKLVVAGLGKDFERFKKQVDTLQMRERVEMRGHVSGPELDQLYAESSCLVFPVRAPETFGWVGVEALAHATPVISSPLGGTTEWLRDGETGISIPPNDKQALSKAIDEILSNPKRARQLGEQGRQLCRQRFSAEAHVQALLALFRHVVSEKRQATVERRYTVVGSQELETRLHLHLSELTDAVRKTVPTKNLEALWLIGGYGKGEGGVVREGKSEQLHNNLDLLLITRRLSSDQRQKLLGLVDEALDSLRLKLGIGIDLSCVSRFQLINAPYRIFWHDLIDGHRCLLGKDSLAHLVPCVLPEQIEPFDFTRLLANRGTLLLINRWLLNQVVETAELRALVIKHIMKAVIGYGDALLHAHGQYHWSYQEKQKRMRRLTGVDEGFRLQYDRAIQYRFQPHPAQMESADLMDWNERLLEELQGIYLDCERRRLGLPTLQWENYFAETAWRQGIEMVFRPLSLAKALARSKDTKKIGKSLSQRLAFFLLADVDKLALCFPFVAFGVGPSSIRQQVQQFLGSKSDHPNLLIKQYLKKWGVESDHNFTRVIENLSIGV